MSNQGKKSDQVFFAKSAGFLAKTVEEMHKRGAAPLSVLLANAIALAKAERMDLEDLSKPPRLLGDEDKRRVRSLLEKAALPGVSLSAILEPELLKVWTKKVPSPAKEPAGKGSSLAKKGKPAAASKRAQAKPKPAGEKPTVVVKKSRLSSVEKGC